jgi:CheY-like chemotaxis protein
MNSVMQKKRILLADDSSTFLRLEQVFLESADYEVLRASDGNEALSVVASKRPDLVVLDLVMPGLEGDRVCSAIKSNPELVRIPVIMVTTRGDADGKARCEKAGCDAFLPKPIRKDRFLAAIQRLLGR